VGPRHDDLRRPWEADAVLGERLEEELSELAAGRPLLRRANRAEDLQGDAALVDRFDALDPRRLQDPALPDRVVVHLAAELVDDLDRLVDIGPEGDRDVLVDPGPRPGPVAGDLDLTVRHRVDDAVEVAQRRPPQAEVLHRPGDAGDRDDIALAVLVLDEDQRAVEVVADEALRAEPDRDADDAEPRDGGADVEVERRQ